MSSGFVSFGFYFFISHLLFYSLEQFGIQKWVCRIFLIFEKISPFIKRIFAFGDWATRTQSESVTGLGTEMTFIHSTNTSLT